MKDVLVSDLITVKEGAEVLGLGIETFRNYLSQKRLPISTYKLGWQLMLEKKDVYRLARERGKEVASCPINS